jgi:hypothetical protein
MATEMMTINTESPFGVTTRNLFSYHEPTTGRLIVMLPGRGYTNEAPVMFHTRQMALENGYDVLSVQYGFQAGNTDIQPEQLPFLQQDVTLAAQPVLARGYREVCIVGKSLGTPLAVELAKTLTTDEISLILLTPIGAALQDMGSIRTLAVIGTKDPLYSPELVNDASPNMRWRVFDGLNHGLIHDGSWRTSLIALPEIIQACETFIKKENP